ncbi:hypothetical protein, partial [Tolypothrix sp. VBCCA 56010]|uniref:hypothetical protein n=1 Tax=Tolypothrix sp. VBCCA 56010 TaxID=3137731 RepID=UPI003D7E1D6B
AFWQGEFEEASLPPPFNGRRKTSRSLFKIGAISRLLLSEQCKNQGVLLTPYQSILVGILKKQD